MKIKLTFILLLFLACIKQSHAQAPAQLTSFFVESPYLSGSDVLINSNPTNIVFDFEIYRGIDGSANGEDIQVSVVLVYRDALGAETDISTPVNVTATSYGSSGSWFYSQRVYGVIPSSYTGGTILLKYSGISYNSFFATWYPFNGYSSTTYGQALGGTPISPPVLYPTYDAFPSQYNSTNFNFTYSDPAGASLPTKIFPSNTQPVLTVGQSIYSPNNNYRLTLQTDGNCVLYRKNSNGTETGIWSTRTVGQSSASLYLQTDGNLVLYAGSATPLSPYWSVWASNIYNYSGLGTVNNAYYALQNDGNLVFYWQNYYYPYSRVLTWIIAGATDTGGGGASAHGGNLNHPVTYHPYDVGSSFHTSR